MATDIQTPVAGGGHAIAQERKKLKKVLFRFDLVFFTIAAFVSLDTIAVAAAWGGGQVFIWLAFLIVVYLIPYGMIIAEMGSTFPVEGGPYVWTRMAFGRLAGSYTAVIYWGSNPVWIGGTLAATCVAAINSLILPEPMSTFWSIVVGLVVVWVTVMLSMIEMKYGKWTGIIGTIVRLLTLFIFLGPGHRLPRAERQARGHASPSPTSSPASSASSPSSACCSSCSSASSSPAARPRR